MDTREVTDQVVMVVMTAFFSTYEDVVVAFEYRIRAGANGVFLFIVPWWSDRGERSGSGYTQRGQTGVKACG